MNETRVGSFDIVFFGVTTTGILSSVAKAAAATAATAAVNQLSRSSYRACVSAVEKLKCLFV